MPKWRNRLGESGSEKPLIENIKKEFKNKIIKSGCLKKATAVSKVQEKMRPSQQAQNFLINQEKIWLN
jgi:hypothetical protein